MPLEHSLPEESLPITPQVAVEFTAVSPKDQAKERELRAELEAFQPYLKRHQKNPLVQMLTALDFLNAEPSLADFTHLLVHLKTEPLPVRGLIIWALGRLPLNPQFRKEAAKALADILEDKQPLGARTARRLVNAAARSAVWGSVSMGSLIGFGMLAYVVKGLSPEPIAWGAAILLICLAVLAGGALLCTPFVIPYSLYADASRARLLRIRAVSTLERLRVPESVGILAKAYARMEPEIRKAAEPALLAVLPTLMPEHYGRMDAEVVPHMCHALLFAATGARAYGSLASSLLQALERMGDGRAVQAVEQVAKKGTGTNLRAEAARILPILRARQEQENAHGTLLRGASSPAVSADQLLRAASDTGVTAADQLLRPTADSRPGEPADEPTPELG